MGPTLGLGVTCRKINDPSLVGTQTETENTELETKKPPRTQTETKVTQTETKKTELETTLNHEEQ